MTHLQVDLDKVFALNQPRDWNRCAGTGVIWDESEGSEPKFRDGAVELGQAVRSVWGSADDDHRAKVAGL